MHLRLFLRSLSRDARVTQSPTYLSPRTHASAMPLERKKVGEVFHFYTKIGVAAIRVTDDGIAIGDTVQIQGPSTNLEQTVEALQIEHALVSRAAPGQEVGMKVRDRVREKDFVYKLIPTAEPKMLSAAPRAPPAPRMPAAPRTAPRATRSKPRRKAPRRKTPARKKTTPKRAKPARKRATRGARSKARRGSRGSRRRSR